MSADVIGCLLLAITEPTDRALVGWHVPAGSLPQCGSRGFDTGMYVDWQGYCDYVAETAFDQPKVLIEDRSYLTSAWDRSSRT